MSRTSIALLLSLFAGIPFIKPAAQATLPSHHEQVAPEPMPTSTVRSVLAPLANLIASGESTTAGGYDAANRGNGMDLGTDGLVKVFGTAHHNITIGQVMDAQAAGRLHAAGRYQIIGRAMRSILKASGLTRDSYFNEENQDRLFETILRTKRPAVWVYLTGRGSSAEAANEISREWAAVAYWDGLGYYSGGYAKVTRPQILSELAQARQRMLTHIQAS